MTEKEKQELHSVLCTLGIIQDILRTIDNDSSRERLYKSLLAIKIICGFSVD